jgi:deoxyinosine 3'endonuclease (endonuclease V)
MMDEMERWREEQLRIASKVVKLPDEQVPSEGGYNFVSFSKKNDDLILLGGVDVSFFSGSDSAVAVYVVTKGESVIYQDSIKFQIQVPYVSSYLAFREIEPLTQLVIKQKRFHPNFTPEVILVDGNGIFHERGAGIASFLGVRTNMKTIGIGKTLYCMDGLNHTLVEGGLKEKLDHFVTNCMNGNLKHCNACNLNNRGDDEGVLVMPEMAIQPDSDGIGKDESSHLRYKDNVESVSNYCDGFAVPLMSKSESILAAALIAHGGVISRRSSSGKAKKGGTKIPIFISIGHEISLLQALQICIRSSYARYVVSMRRSKFTLLIIFVKRMNLINIYPVLFLEYLKV